MQKRVITLIGSIVVMLTVTGALAFTLSYVRQEITDTAKLKSILEVEAKKLKRENESWEAQIARGMTPQRLQSRAMEKDLRIPESGELIYAYERYEGGRVENSTREKRIVSFHTPSDKKVVRTAKK